MITRRKLHEAEQYLLLMLEDNLLTREIIVSRFTSLISEVEE